jgi:putative SOS response-associated peptidase YedK
LEKAGHAQLETSSEHRCVVPATAFSEPDKNTPKGAMVWHWFERADRQPFFFAGIWRPWTGDRGTKKVPNIGDHALFSIMTTEPNGIVEPIHEEAMPVMRDTLNFIAPRHFNSIELSHPLRATRIHSVTTWEAITGAKP